MLNKRGWGLVEMLVASGVLILFSMIAIYYVYTMYNNISDTVYALLEEKLENQAQIYLDEYYEGQLVDEMVINRSTLSKHGLDVTLRDSDNRLCSGYVLYTNGTVKGYISCLEYETEGYQD